MAGKKGKKFLKRARRITGALAPVVLGGVGGFALAKLTTPKPPPSIPELSKKIEELAQQKRELIAETGITPQELGVPLPDSFKVAEVKADKNNKLLIMGAVVGGVLLLYFLLKKSK